MPSFDRFEPRARHGRARPFDADQPWDAQSAEALTRLCESDEGNLLQCYKGDRARRVQPSPNDIPATQVAQGAGVLADRPWLEARLADIAQRLQASLADLNPDKSLAPFNRRLDLIEERFGEALARVAQRSDLEGLRLIEAQVLELAAHVQEARGRLERIDAVDDRVRTLSSRLEQDGNQRLEALEKLLQDYVAEWRRGDERTAGSLRTLEDAVSRIGETVDTMEASKPAQDLSLALLDPADLGKASHGSDLLEQIYAEGERALAPKCYRSTLDAADYMPRPERVGAAEASPAGAVAAADGPAASAVAGKTPPALPDAMRDWSVRPGDDEPAGPQGHDLAPPAFRALAMRAKLRQAEIADADVALEDGQQPPPSSGTPATDPARPATARTRPGLLLGSGIVLFALGGYLAVDAYMSAGASPRGPGQIERGVLPGYSQPILAEPHAPALDTAPAIENAPPKNAPPRTGPRLDDQEEAARPPTAPLYRQPPSETDVFTQNAPDSRDAARIGGLGGALAAVLRAQTPPVETAAIVQHGIPGNDQPALPQAAALPLTIGPASLRQAAQRGDPIAQHEVAARYAAGQGVGRDLHQALQWYTRAAIRGLAPAQYRLAALYERGLGTAADPERAKVWYKRAAEQGHVKSMHNLAVLSAAGARSDFAAAAKWFAEAAAYGLTDSQFNFAVLCQNGLGVPKDLRQAYKWLTLATRGGDTEAATRMAHLKTQIAAADLQAAEEMVAAWRPRAPDATINELPPAALAGQ